MAERKLQALRKVEQLRKKGHSVSPVNIRGRAIATTFWGKAWCENLERNSDFVNRLPRGRIYPRNGSVIDLQIAQGEVKALVSGSSIYEVEVKITPVRKSRWKSMQRLRRSHRFSRRSAPRPTFGKSHGTNLSGEHRTLPLAQGN